MKLEDIPEPLRTQLKIDELIYGNAFVEVSSDGTMKRIDPTTVLIKSKFEGGK